MNRTLVFFLLWGLCASAALAGSEIGFRILKISAQDDRAVVRETNGKTRLIKPGDTVGEKISVTEIAQDRVVLEDRSGTDVETVIIRLDNGKQKVERIRKTAPGKKQQITTAVSVQREDSAQFTVPRKKRPANRSTKSAQCAVHSAQVIVLSSQCAVRSMQVTVLSAQVRPKEQAVDEKNTDQFRG